MTIDACGHLSAARLRGRVLEKGAQCRNYDSGSIFGLRQTSSQSEPFDPPAVVELIVPVGHDEMGNARLDRLRECADPAVIDEQRGSWQQGAEGQIAEHSHVRRRAPAAPARESSSPASRARRGSRAASTDSRKYWCMVAAADPGVKTTGGGPPSRNPRPPVEIRRRSAIPQRKSDQVHVRRPIGLKWREPVRKESDDELGRVHPAMHDPIDRFQPERWRGTR